MSFVEDPDMSVLRLQGFKPYFEEGRFTGVAFLEPKHMGRLVKSISVKTHRQGNQEVWVIAVTGKNGGFFTCYVDHVTGIYTFILPLTVYPNMARFVKALSR